MPNKQMSESKCRACGSTEIETDPGRGDAVCTNCGVVLEDQLIVNETTFDETSSGNMMVRGQFVSNESTGGANYFGGGNNIIRFKNQKFLFQLFLKSFKLFQHIQ